MENHGVTKHNSETTHSNDGFTEAVSAF